MEHDYGSVNPPNGYEPTSTSSKSDLIEKDKESNTKNYPYSVFFILSNEFCERFSYYGMRAILVLYLTRWLGFGDAPATSIFHAWSMMCYFMPLIGAVVADGYLGRYRTILIVSCVYFVGSLVLAVTAVPPPEVIGPSIGLFLIACGTGGIKASVAPFGADQFVPGQEKWQNSFFSAFYFMINLGSTISILLTPVLRADVQCFEDDCYLLAFGVPAILMLLSICLFFMGRNQYTRVPPTGDVIGKTFKCIFSGIVGKFQSTKYEEERPHWLYYADDKFENWFIEDVRRLLRVLLMFLPLPLFWALNNQQGSRWTLQAEHMDGSMGIFGKLKPDQMQALNPLLILIMIPILDKIVYPFLDKCRIPNRPLQRMVVGLYISSLAFVCAGLVQMKIDKAEDPALGAGQTGITFLNTLPCNVKVTSPFYEGNVLSLQMSDFLDRPDGHYRVKVESLCGKTDSKKVEQVFNFADRSSYRVIVYETEDKALKIGQFPDQRSKPKNGDSALSIFSTTDVIVNHISLITNTRDNLQYGKMGVIYNISQYNVSEFFTMEPSKYGIFVPDLVNDKWINMGISVQLNSGGVYTVFISGNEKNMSLTLYVDLKENTVSMLWLVPQYILITVGEVLFSVAGISFAYSQAPNSMKSVVQAMWLSTTALGDLVVIIVANIHAIPSQMAEFYLFAILMFIDTVIFMIMSFFYNYKPNSLYTELPDELTIPTDGLDNTITDRNVDTYTSNSENVPLHLRKVSITPQE
ncbi:solute carrier family 15 member 1-like [Mya arenaria]|uniref:solute carrier family 15 member 1-like n=1 Tax=Mya arenaria TaxID=6604 RepID=UPI0022E7A41C|nr:solute carrier family 15 member 1-like [Mya arenaria]XP_052814792.1 solute carrier family 15 member 1-like [Mya arenaria]